MYSSTGYRYVSNLSNLYVRYKDLHHRHSSHCASLRGEVPRFFRKLRYGGERPKVARKLRCGGGFRPEAAARLTYRTGRGKVLPKVADRALTSTNVPSTVTLTLTAPEPRI